jgi:hypothetical protein
MKKNLFDKWGFGRLVAATVFTVALVFSGCGNVVDDGGLAGISPKDGALSVASLASVSLAPGSDTFEDTHLAEFSPYINALGDYYMFDETGGYHISYIMSDADPVEYAGFDVLGDIRYIKHFGNNVTVNITVPDEDNPGQTIDIPFTGAAGVLIFEVYDDPDPETDLDYNWAYSNDDPVRFTASYYYDGVIEDDILVSAKMGIAATSVPPIVTPCFDTLEDAINEFASVGSLQTYITEIADYMQ